MRALLLVVGWALLASSAGAAPARQGAAKDGAALPKPGAPARSIRLALAPFVSAKGVAPRVQRQLVDSAEAALQEKGLEVFGPAALNAVVGAESVRTCGESTCLLGFARAVEADFVAQLALQRTRKQARLTINVLDARDGSTVAALASELPNIRRTALVRATADLAPRVEAAMRERRATKVEPPGESVRVVEAVAEVKPVTPPVPAEPAVVAPPPRSYLERKAVPLTLMGLGVGAAGLGSLVFGLQASRAVDDFRNGFNAAAAREDATRAGVLFDLSVGVGAAVALTGAAILLFAPDEPAPSVGISAAPNGVSVQGVF